VLSAIVGALLLGCAHPNSFSSSTVHVAGAAVELEVRCQARSLAEALPLDLDGDGALSADELRSGESDVARYVRGHYVVLADSQHELALHAVEVVPAPPLAASDEPFVLARFTGTAERALQEVSLRCTLFRESNPLHRDTCTIVWGDEEPASWLFPDAGAVFRFEPDSRRRPGVFSGYVALGVEHILTGYDHLAFLAALLLAVARLRSMIGVISAFTVAHTATLALSTFDLVRVDPRAVELAIALSIAYVAALDLVARKPATRWLEAFGFGLIHGLGFASSVAAALQVERLKVTALVGFNLGVELGQFAVIALAFACLAGLPGDRSGADGTRFVAPRLLRRTACAALIAFGLWLFAARAGWVPGLA
jgi:hypothetical protein